MQVVNDMLTMALSDTLETMAFATVTGAHEASIVPTSGSLVEIQFEGPCMGMLQIWGGGTLGQLLAENIGCLEETDEQSAKDAWQEICNVVCGLVLPSLADDPADVFDMSVPRLIHDSLKPSWESFTSQSDVHIFDVEGYAVAARLTVEACA